MSLDKKILEYYLNMSKPTKMPSGIASIYPFGAEETKRVMQLFYEKYYADNAKRGFLFGINPGRFGSGITGIGFTDAVTLEKNCKIENSFEKRSEASATFIYEVIEAYGGAESFYKDFYITAVMPLGLLKKNKNYNYYDDKQTLTSLEKFIKKNIDKQLAFGVHLKDAICIGQGKNLSYLEAYNEKHKVFDNIYALPHPRWVMQYRRKEKDKYIQAYLDVFAKVLS